MIYLNFCRPNFRLSYINYIEAYYDDLAEENEKISRKKMILNQIQNPKSPFLAFKLRIIQDNYEYRKEFLS